MRHAQELASKALRCSTPFTLNCDPQRLLPTSRAHRCTQARTCGGCSGRKMSAEVANVQYYIRPGTGDGGTCHVRGEGSCDVGEEPGDIQVKISVQKHERYV